MQEGVEGLRDSAVGHNTSVAGAIQLLPSWEMRGSHQKCGRGQIQITGRRRAGVHRTGSMTMRGGVVLKKVL